MRDYRRPSRDTNDLAALSQGPPSRFGWLWWSGLVVLVVNDHLLKGAGVLPGWVTGKLSDFAGLIVAPLLVVVLVRARTARARAAALAVVAAPFCAIKIWVQAAHVVEVA